MFKLSLILVTLILSYNMAQAGFLGNPLAYSSGFPPTAEHRYNRAYETTYSTTYGAPYAAPLPVAPVNGGHHPYGAVGYSTPSVVKFRSSGGNFDCNPFTAYGSVRSHHKFAFPAPVPSVYNAPPPASFASPPAVTYSGFEVPNTVLKFGPPITTTTTTYSTASAAPGNPGTYSLNAVPGW